MKLQYPNITAGAPAEQIEQIKRYLYQLVEQMNVQDNQLVSVASAAPVAAKSAKSATEDMSPVGVFNQLKSLIIKSADIVEAYSEQIQKDLSGVYVAQSDFGTYTEQTNAQITANSKDITTLFDNVQTLINDEIAAEAYIKQGLLFYVGEDNLEPELGVNLDDGVPVYGLEVGQTVDRNGEKVFDRFARFTSYGATFYDQNRQLAAYITNRQFESPNVKIGETLTRGGYVETIGADGGRVERWVGI